VLLQLGAVGVVLAALPYRTFELDRYFVPKELVLHSVAVVVALVGLVRMRRLELARIDEALLLFLGLGLVSALFATNHWLAIRALAISLSGAALFWMARSVARAGLARPLLIVLGTAVVIGVLTSLLQAYGVDSEYFSRNRSPGGSFGNRNFMAHLTAIGLPVLVMLTMEAGRAGFALGGAGVVLSAAALVLSRCRAAWVAVVVCVAFFAVAGLWRGRLWYDRALRRRLGSLALAAVFGMGLAVLLPNSLDWKSDSPYLESLRGVANYREGSGRGRLLQYRNTLLLGLRHPVLGVGPGNWSVLYPKIAPPDDPSISRDDGMTANPWPSSDWMTILSERGLPAFLLLTVFGLALFLHGWRWWAESPQKSRDLEGLALATTLLAVGVAGMFDAIIVLPAPTFMAWTIAGALATPERTRRTIEMTRDRRRWTLAVVGLLGMIALVRTASQVGAMKVWTRSWRPAELERASRIDPGSYRMHIMLGERYFNRGRCDQARPHAAAAARQFPYAPDPRRLLRACGAPVPRP
jgi:O-antigen ligase